MDLWLRQFVPVIPSPPLFDSLKVSEFWMPRNKEWDVELLEELFSEHDARAITGIPLCRD